MSPRQNSWAPVQDAGRPEGVVLNVAQSINGDSSDFEATRGCAPLHVVKVLVCQIGDGCRHTLNRCDQRGRVVRGTRLGCLHEQNKARNLIGRKNVALGIGHRVGAVNVYRVRNSARISVGVIHVLNGVVRRINGDGQEIAHRRRAVVTANRRRGA